MPLGTWPDVTDDDATGTSGTPVDKAWADAVRDSVEDAIFSSANPTISPGETTDEVVDARGVFNSLSTRLDDLQGLIGGAAEESSTLAASENIAKNPDLSGWKNGDALEPDHFALTGAGASVARAAGIGAGPFSVRLTYGAASALLTQTLIDSAEWSDQAALGSEGRKLSLTARVVSSVADLARIVISDGVTSTESAFHTGSGDAENLTVTHTISGSATELTFYLEVVQAGSADFAGFIAVFSDSPAPSWQPPPRPGHRNLDINVTTSGNVDAAPTDLMVYKCSPNLLRANGVTLHAHVMGLTNVNAATKKLTFQFGAALIVLFNASINNKQWVFDLYVARLTSATQIMWAHGGYSTTSFTESIAAAEDETAEITFKLVGDATTTNDIVQSYMLIEVIEPSAGI